MIEALAISDWLFGSTGRMLVTSMDEKKAAAAAASFFLIIVRVFGRKSFDRLS
jgi:hypothetical protein